MVVAVINGEVPGGRVRVGQVQVEQVGGARQVQGAGFRQRTSPLLQEVGDVFATVSLVFVGIEKGAADLIGAIDFDQRQDFLDVMAGVEPALPQLFVVIGGLGAELQEPVQELLL